MRKKILFILLLCILSFNIKAQSTETDTVIQDDTPSLTEYDDIVNVEDDKETEDLEITIKESNDITHVEEQQIESSDNIIIEDSSVKSPDNSVIIDNKTGFPIIINKPFIVFNEGFTASWLTRIIKKEDKSNFVFNDFMAGIYFGFKTVNMQPLNSVVRVSLYYPLLFKFNDVPQIPSNIIRFAVDLFAGINFELNMWQYIRFNLSPGIHAFFQNSDRWNYIDVGVAGLAGLELPLAKKWTILVNGIASLDYGNFGTNAPIEIYDIVYQYQIDIGFRFSKKAINKYSYIKSKN